MKRERLSESSPAFHILSVEPRYGHGYGCLQARGVDNPDTSPHRHMLIFQVRSGVHPLSPTPFCPLPLLAPVLLI